MIPQRVLERVFESCEVRGAHECWPWTKSCGSHGYGQIGWWADGKSHVTTAHRAAWEAVHGEIGPDLTVHQTCVNSLCINPVHMELLPNAAVSGMNAQSRRTHCPIGHPYAGRNLHRRPSGERRCRACAATRYRARAFSDRLAARALEEFFAYYDDRLDGVRLR